MINAVKQYRQRFDAQSIRERGLIGFTLVVVTAFLWWNNYATPLISEVEMLQTENQRIEREIENTRNIVSQIRNSIASGVHREKKAQLVKLERDLVAIEDQLQTTTVELIDPEKMFQLLNELIYRDSKLKLLSLKRREVKPAIPVAEGEEVGQPGIYRHVLEIEFAGKYLDILSYMETLEALDWKLLWDEIEIVSDEHPVVTFKLVISTLSTRKEWVGI
jgi:MSHA biogenesis protein MshJ